MGSITNTFGGRREAIGRISGRHSPRPESFSDLVTPRRLGRGRGTPTIRAGRGTFTYKSHSTFSRHTRKMWL